MIILLAMASTLTLDLEMAILRKYSIGSSARILKGRELMK